MQAQLAAAEQGVVTRAKRDVVVTDGDIAILRFVHEYRMLRIEQVAALTGRTYTRIHRRLKSLYDGGYLKRRSFPQAKDIYYLNRQGLSILLAHGVISEDDAVRRSREHELKPQTVQHEMMISDVHLMLALATRVGPLQLLNWRQGDEIRDTFEVVENGISRTIAIAPDAVFQIRHNDLNAVRTYFAEIDRGTMPTVPRAGSQRFRDKIERYRAFIEAGRPAERFCASAIRIVTVTLTQARRDNLCSDTDEFLAANNAPRLRKSFLFGAFRELSIDRPDVVLSTVFRRPGSDKSFCLFPLTQDAG